MKIDDEKRATFWIRRWKMVGGGFEVAEIPDGYEITIARRTSAVASTEAIFAKTAASLAAELENNPDKRRAVMAIVGRQLEATRAAEQETRDAHSAPRGDDDPPEAA